MNSKEFDRDAPTVVSLFSGAGGLDIGFEQAGFQTLFASDMEAAACETLRMNRELSKVGRDQLNHWLSERVFSQRCHNRMSDLERRSFVRRISEAHDRRTVTGPRHVHCGDVRSVSGDDILTCCEKRRGEIDVVIGGPPCQPFSRAGKREMMRNEDGLLFLDYIRIVRDLRPRFFVFENVKGMVNQKSDVKFGTCHACARSTIPPFESICNCADETQILARCDHCQTDQFMGASKNGDFGLKRAA